MSEIDINCDLGESYGAFQVGNDSKVFPYITSCNIACGQHGGDPITIENTIDEAIKHNVQIGAHPSYPDLAGFGRRNMQLSGTELRSLIKSQIAIIDGLARSKGSIMQYVKPHGALYNSLAKNKHEATDFTEAIASYNYELAIMGLPNSELEIAAQKKGLKYIREGFIDRRYHENGSLVSRSDEQAVLTSIPDMLLQFEKLAKTESVSTLEGKTMEMKVDSLCIHGDNPQVIELLIALHKKAQTLKIKLQKVPL